MAKAKWHIKVLVYMAVPLLAAGMVPAMGYAADEDMTYTGSSHLDSALGAVISGICNFSLADIDVPNVIINGEEVETSLPDISIARMLIFLTQSLRGVSDVASAATGDGSAADVADDVSDMADEDYKVEIDGAELKEKVSGAAGGYYSFWKRLAMGVDSDLSPVFERMEEDGQEDTEETDASGELNQ